MTTVFQNLRWRSPPSRILKLYFSEIEVPMFSQILVTIGQIVKKWQQFFENQDGGGRHLELWLFKFVTSLVCHWCVVNQNCNLPTEFDDNRSISNEMATVFHYRHLEFSEFCISDVIDIFQIEVPMF